MPWVYIVAEIGSNWRSAEPSPLDVVRCVYAAKEVGANAVKFQLWKAEEFISAERDEQLYWMCKKYEFPLEWLDLVFRAASEVDIDLGFSVFSPAALNALDQFARVNKRFFVKVASSDFGDPWMHRVASFAEEWALPLVVSTGGVGQGAILEQVVELRKKYSALRAVLHCVAEYPASPSSAQVWFVSTLKEVVDRQPGELVFVGLSDHFLSDEPALLALGAGAQWFEKHLKPKHVRGYTPDTGVSLNEKQFAAYVKRLHDAARMVGDGGRRVTVVERVVMQKARRGTDGKRPPEEEEL